MTSALASRAFGAAGSTILVVAAHPDDELLGLGGTLARLVAEGCHVDICILGEGATSRADARNAGAPEVSALAAQAKAAAALLGVRRLALHALPDNRFDTVPLLDVIKIVEREIATSMPQTVLAHHASDLNIDHQIAHRAVLTATRPTPGQGVTSVLAFEAPSSTEWAFAGSAAGFRPQLFVDLSAAHFDKKLNALAAYAGEMRAAPHPRSRESLTARARAWGAVAGVELAEAFEVIRQLQ